MNTAAASLITAWFAAAFTLSIRGSLEGISSGILLLTGLFTPIAVYFVLLSISGPFRDFAGGLNLRYVTLAETPRIIGGTYILLDSKLPDLFALPTGISDIAVGVSAPLAAKFLLTRDGLPKPGFRLWHAIGLFWIVVSVVTGTLTAPAPVGLVRTGITSQAMSAFPLSLIPSFLGPMVILCHLVALSRTAPKATHAAA